MNLKKAKAFRGLVKELIKKEVLKGDWARYGVVKHTKAVPTGKFDETGLEVKGDHVTQTIVLDPMCPKGVYRRMKKNGPMSVLAGQA